MTLRFLHFLIRLFLSASQMMGPEKCVKCCNIFMSSHQTLWNRTVSGIVNESDGSELMMQRNSRGIVGWQVSTSSRPYYHISFCFQNPNRTGTAGRWADEQGQTTLPTGYANGTPNTGWPTLNPLNNTPPYPKTGNPLWGYRCCPHKTN